MKASQKAAIAHKLSKSKIFIQTSSAPGSENATPKRKRDSLTEEDLDLVMMKTNTLESIENNDIKGSILELRMTPKNAEAPKPVAMVPITKQQYEDSDFKKAKKKKTPTTAAKFSSKTLQDLSELPSVHEVNSNGSSTYDEYSTKRGEKRLSNHLARARPSKLSAYL